MLSRIAVDDVMNGCARRVGTLGVSRGEHFCGCAVRSGGSVTSARHTLALGVKFHH